MDAASEEVAVQLAAQGVIGKRVDQMETGFMMALDYMIQTAEKDQDDQVVRSDVVMSDDLSTMGCCLAFSIMLVLECSENNQNMVELCCCWERGLIIEWN